MQAERDQTQPPKLQCGRRVKWGGMIVETVGPVGDLKFGGWGGQVFMGGQPLDGGDPPIPPILDSPGELGSIPLILPY